MENPGISRMQSERSNMWANSPQIKKKGSLKFIINFELDLSFLLENVYSKQNRINSKTLHDGIAESVNGSRLL